MNTSPQHHTLWAEGKGLSWRVGRSHLSGGTGGGSDAIHRAIRVFTQGARISATTQISADFLESSKHRTQY
jgi:hypothetical protein